MRVISFRKLREYFEKDPAARVSMQEWFKIVKKAEWENFNEMKRTFNSVDSVGNQRYVFNIKGNNYRVIAKVLFQYQRVYIRWVGNHKDYNRLKNIENL